MKILVLNSGSSSLKFQVLDMETQTVVTKGIVEKIGLEGSFLDYEVTGNSQHVDQQVKDHHEAVHLVFDLLTGGKFQILGSLSELGAIGHRVVHGGEHFHDAALIDDGVIEKIEECSKLAPLHNPAELAGIVACREVAPQIPQIAVFDTAFHQTMTPEHYLYPLPYSYYEKYTIRRYGFHGTSHQFVFNKLIENGTTAKAGQELKMDDCKVITCHVGNGASITAIQDGKVVETSMGMTPMEGVMMGTRAGSIDPGVILYLIKNEGLTSDQLGHVLNEQSGLLGVSGSSGDMRDILAGYGKKEEKCLLAMNMYINSIVKYIGSYVSLLNGVDAIVFTGGILERSKVVRKLIMDRLARLGVSLDEKVNDFATEERVISRSDSSVLVKVIPTNEELMIAQEAYRLLQA